MTGSRLTVVVVSVALLTTPAVRMSAHHSFAAEFDATKPITLTGTVTKIEMVNPHGWIYIDVKQPDGTVKNWAIEAVAPSTLAARGFRRNTIPIGLELVVQGYRAKDGSTTANGNIIKLPDGRELAVGAAANSGAASDKPAGGAVPY
jgi:Family of unknown function (DUF6152)